MSAIDPSVTARRARLVLPRRDAEPETRPSWVAPVVALAIAACAATSLLVSVAVARHVHPPHACVCP